MPDSLKKTTGDSVWADARVAETNETPMDATPVYGSASHDAIICFSAGTHIKTPFGDRRVETLAIGDHVITRDGGPEPIRWIGQETVRATGALAPIRFTKGTLGNYRDLLVSPQHRMLFTHQARSKEILIPAKQLVDHFQISTDFGGMVTYVHMLFDRHEVVFANGAASESFFPAAGGLETLTDEARAEVFQLFPKLRSDLAGYGPPNRDIASPSYRLNHAA